jgi:hypothetical protein
MSSGLSWRFNAGEPQDVRLPRRIMWPKNSVASAAETRALGKTREDPAYVAVALGGEGCFGW